LDTMTEKSIANDLGKLLLENAEETMDVILKSGGEDIRVHKSVLVARSPVFKAMFSTEMKEKKENEIDMTDATVIAIKEMKKFMYLGIIAEEFQETEELMKLADKYEIEDLRIECTQILLKSINNNNVFKLGILGEIYNSNELVRNCAEHIKNNRDNIDVDEETSRDLLTHPAYTLEILKMFLGGPRNSVEVKRFITSSNGWCHSGAADAIRFTVNKESVLHGIGLYGSRGSLINVTLKIYDEENSLLEESFSFVSKSETNEPTTYNLSQPVKVLPHVKYDISTQYNSGHQTFHGNNGCASVGSSFIVSFSQSAWDGNGTSVASGQIATLYFRVHQE